MAAPVSSGAANASTQNSPEHSAGTKRVISAGEALSLAKALLDQGKADDAEKIYTALRATPNEDIRIEAIFQLAHVYVRQGKYRRAVSLFHEILNSRPNLARVRLDLAQAYFLDKNYADATFQFELVKGGDLPPEVLANVDLLLDAIRRQKNWTIDFSLSPVSDSNINQASGGGEECIDTIWGTLCRPLEAKSSGMGLSANATADYFWRFHQDWGLRGTAGFYGTTYEEKDYNDYILYTALGPRYLWDSGEASVQPIFRKRWTGDKEYSEEYGLRLDTRQIYRRLMVNTGATMSWLSYNDSYVDDFLNGITWNAYINPRYILTGQTFIQSGLGFMREETKARSYTNDNWRYSLGVYHAFSYGISLFVEGSLTQAKYQASQWYITKDNKIDETVRADKTWRVLTSLSSNVFERYGLTPVFQYTYTRRDSNIWTRAYERHRFTTLLDYRF